MAGEPSTTYHLRTAAAARFGVRRDRLRKAAAEGRLGAVRPGAGSAYLVREEDVREFLRTSHRGRTPQPTTPAAGPPAPIKEKKPSW